MPRDFPADIVEVVSHRPWPIPDRPWVMTQTWHDLLFAHWPLPASALAPLVPSDFELDLFDARAWIGVVPFYMTNVALRGMPAVPGISAFAELNVRTYVTAEGKPGVYFFSLDAASRIAAHAARLLLRLPYYPARMRVERQVSRVRYWSQRRSDSTAAFAAEYRGRGAAAIPAAGSLEHFLTERYCLYARGWRGGPYRLEIHHPPWSLYRGEAEIGLNTMADAAGVRLPRMSPVLHYARRQDMVAWAPVALRSR